MLSLFHSNGRSTAARRDQAAAFTLVEVLAGVAILGLVVGVAIFGLSQINYYASVNRLYTAAQTLAQNQIDLLLTKGPYDPAATPAMYPTPNILGNDTSDFGSGVYTYYSDPSVPLTLYSSPRPVTIYRDPMNSNSATNVVVQGTIKTEIKQSNHTVPVVVAGVTTNHSLYLRQATVTVGYTFRGRPFSVVMNTMRTPDQ